MLWSDMLSNLRTYEESILGCCESFDIDRDKLVDKHLKNSNFSDGLSLIRPEERIG